MYVYLTPATLMASYSVKLASYEHTDSLVIETSTNNPSQKTVVLLEFLKLLLNQPTLGLTIDLRTTDSGYKSSVEWCGLKVGYMELASGINK